MYGIKYFYKKTIRITFVLAFLFLLKLGSTVHAGEVNILASSASFYINADNTIGIVYKLTLQNTGEEDLVSGYEFDLPFTDTELHSVKLSNRNLNTVISGTNTSTKIAVNFSGNSLSPGRQATLELSFKTSNNVIEVYGGKLVYLPAYGFSQGSLTTDYTISWAKDFGFPSFVSLMPKKTGDNSLTLSTNKPLSLFWGESYSMDIESKFVLKNRSSSNGLGIINIPKNEGSQDITFLNFNEIIHGLRDLSGNDFIVTDLDNGEEKEVLYQAKVKKSNIEEENFVPLKIPDKIFSTELYRQLIGEMNIYDDNLQKLQIAKNFLLANLQIKAKTNEVFNEEKLISKLDPSYSLRTFNQLECSFLVAATAKRLGYEASLEYGYLAFPEIDILDIGMPRAWNRIKIEDKYLLVDIFSEKTSGIEFFTFSKPFDRINFGTWEQQQSHNDVLGLNSGSAIQKRFSDVALNPGTTNDEGITMNLNFPPEAHSGEYFEGTIIIDNKTPYIMQIESILVNGVDRTDNILIDKDFAMLVLPGAKNSIGISRLKELNYLSRQTKLFKFDVTFEGDYQNKISAQTIIKFNPDLRIFGALLSVIVFLLILFIYIIVKRKMTSRI